MKNIKQQYPALKLYTYLNTASSGPISERLHEFRLEHDLDLLISGSNLQSKQDTILTQTREAVGRLFKAAPNRVALLPSFSFGFNTLMEGVDTSKRVLLIKEDYPSLNWAVESRGFKTFYVSVAGNLEENIFEVIEREKPDIFAFSLVQWISGIKLGMEFLSKLKKAFPELLLFADGTQFCGTEQFDFDNSAGDVLGASAYKWLNAGFGNAFFLFKETVQHHIDPKAVGFGSTMGKYKDKKDGLIGKFEPGHQDTLNFGSLLTAIQQVEDIGMENIETYLSDLSTQVRNAFQAANLLDETVSLRESHSSIFNIRADESLFGKLTSRGILCSQRGQGIRVSFHYYNDLNDLDKLLGVIKN